MNAFLVDLLTRVGQSAEAAKIYSTRLAAQLAIELQLDRVELDQGPTPSKKPIVCE
jgi:hypothetical protein